MKRRLDVCEFEAWKYYYKLLSPGGPRSPEEEHADYRQAITNVILANVYRDERRQPYSVDDFRIFPREEKQDDQEANDAKIKGMIAIMNQLTAVQNQVVKDGRLKA